MHMFVHLFTAALVLQRLPYLNNLIWMCCANEYISQRVICICDTIFSVHMQVQIRVVIDRCILCRSNVKQSFPARHPAVSIGCVWGQSGFPAIAGNPLYANSCVLHNLPLEYWHIWYRSLWCIGYHNSSARFVLVCFIYSNAIIYHITSNIIILYPFSLADLTWG